MDGLPAGSGLQLDERSGVFSGTPNPNDRVFSTNKQLQITAQDGRGGSATAAVHLTISSLGTNFLPFKPMSSPPTPNSQSTLSVVPGWQPSGQFGDVVSLQSIYAPSPMPPKPSSSNSGAFGSGGVVSLPSIYAPSPVASKIPVFTIDEALRNDISTAEILSEPIIVSSIEGKPLSVDLSRKVPSVRGK